MSYALQVSGLSKSFGAIAVTREVSFSLAPGARHALIGPNGSGKTTLVGLLSGVLRPDAGRIELMGSDITQASPQARVKLGLVRTFQINSLFTSLSVLENVMVALGEHRGASWRLLRPLNKRRDLIDEAHTVIARLGLASDAHRQVKVLPYGRQRLVEIAIAVALEPQVLLLDEPAAGIPSAEVPYILEEIERLPKDIAILMIEHDMALIRRFAQEVTVLVAGEILTSGSPSDVMADPEVRRVYLGSGGEARFRESERLHA
jgi:branched-chain amino acid transport system ATP-binding protein